MAGSQGILVLDENADDSGGTLPNAPTDLNLKDISVAEVELHWTDNSTNETGFIVVRSVNN